MEQLINNYSKDLIQVLNKVITNGSKNYKTYTFDCNFFNEIEESKIRSTNEHAKYQSVLRSLNGPVIYWFQIVSQTDSQIIRNAILDYGKTNHKKVPALKKTYDKTSDILYVGKVKRNFWSRVIQHIGIYNNARTQGLQLMYWTEGLDLKLRLHAYQFEEDMSDLVALFERKLAKELKPIIGKH